MIKIKCIKELLFKKITKNNQQLDKNERTPQKNRNMATKMINTQNQTKCPRATQKHSVMHFFYQNNVKLKL